MKKILIVDDNIDILYTLKKGLEYIDDTYDVHTAQNQIEFHKVMDEKPFPDLIFLDIMMPDINGWDLFTKIKENIDWKHIPVVFLTAKTDPFCVGFGQKNAEAYVKKPFDIKALKETIDNILG